MINIQWKKKQLYRWTQLKNAFDSSISQQRLIAIKLERTLSKVFCGTSRLWVVESSLCYPQPAKCQSGKVLTNDERRDFLDFLISKEVMSTIDRATGTPNHKLRVRTLPKPKNF